MAKGFDTFRKRTRSSTVRRFMYKKKLDLCICEGELVAGLVLELPLPLVPK